MRLINVDAFLEREKLFGRGERIDRRAKVLEFGDDEVAEYAILSHRWTEQEVDYNEIVKLAKMDEEERTEIRHRGGYRKILESCEQAKKDGYRWLWVDTCCIDKRSSAELSEAINSMYRWYENSGICYTYLHDVHGSSLPTVPDDMYYHKSNGWPEWFSRGWTLQEMIAPTDVRFFNRDWYPIGDKKTLSITLEYITQVPQHILKEGLSSNRPCVAQIMSWAANRTTTRVEDRAYSLMGLLDVNMPMLYGEGKKAFHRLQLEIIRTSNDQSIFAWGWNPFVNVRAGSILADDPSFFLYCGGMELVDHDEFIESLKEHIPEEELLSVEDDRFGTFHITNRGIQIWLFLRPRVGSDSVFQALLPCRSRPLSPPVAINLALWESNYYRYPMPFRHEGERLQLRQIYLRYQDMPCCNPTFEIDDSAIHKAEGFTYSGRCTEGTVTGNTVTLSTTDLLCVSSYSCHQEYQFAIGFGHCFGQSWMHVICKEPDSPLGILRSSYDVMLDNAPEHARSMKKARSGAAHCQVYILQTRLPWSTWILQISCVMWKSSGTCGVKFEVFQDPGFSNLSDEWTGFDVDGTDDPDRDWRGLMIPYCPSKQRISCELLMDGVSITFLHAPFDIKLGDYGHFTDSEDFCYEGNLFADLESLSFEANVTQRQHKISSRDERKCESILVMLGNWHFGGLTELYKPHGLSLPSNDDLKSLLVSFSTRLTNRYLVTRVVQCPPDPRRPGSRTKYFYSIAKPFVWHRNDGAGSVMGGTVRRNAWSPSECG